MLNSTSSRGKVYKLKRFGVCPNCNPQTLYVDELPWLGSNPWLGTRRFDTQPEAFFWAVQKAYMVNNAFN